MESRFDFVHREHFSRIYLYKKMAIWICGYLLLSRLTVAVAYLQSTNYFSSMAQETIHILSSKTHKRWPNSIILRFVYSDYCHSLTCEKIIISGRNSKEYQDTLKHWEEEDTCIPSIWRSKVKVMRLWMRFSSTWVGNAWIKDA